MTWLSCNYFDLKSLQNRIKIYVTFYCPLLHKEKLGCQCKHDGTCVPYRICAVKSLNLYRVRQ